MPDTSLQQLLTVGLRQDERLGLNGESMSTYFGVRPTPFGARSQEDIEDFLEFYDPGATTRLGISNAHPFPQLFKGFGVTLLADSTAIYEQDLVTGVFTEVPLYDIYDKDSFGTITANGPWHFVDFHSTWFLLNGETVVMRTNNSVKTFVQTLVKINTACMFMGRMVFGGLDSTYWDARVTEDTRGWTDLWSEWTSNSVGLGIELGSPGNNWIGWSSIGGGDLLNVFDKSLAIDPTVFSGLEGIYSEEDPYFFELMKRAESGFMPMEHQGFIQVVKQLGKHVVVYGDNAISLVSPHKEPVPCLGLTVKLLDIGVLDRGAVGGDEREHIFIDKSGTLWRLGIDFQLTRLDYREHVNRFSDGFVTISLDPSEREYYITGTTTGDVERTFLLNQNGLCESNKIVHSVVRDGDGLKGVFTNQTSPSSTWKIKTFDITLDVISTVQKVHVSLGDDDDPTVVTVRLQIRNDLSETLSNTVSGTLDKFGDVYLNGTGRHVRVDLVQLSGSASGIQVNDVVLSFSDRTRTNLKARIA